MFDIYPTMSENHYYCCIYKTIVNFFLSKNTAIRHIQDKFNHSNEYINVKYTHSQYDIGQYLEQSHTVPVLIAIPVGTALSF
jgi:hypothetical protein